jgi:hypothetical protein
MTSESNCPICLQEVSDETLYLPNCQCNGKYHQDCWDTWKNISGNCPTCRIITKTPKSSLFVNPLRHGLITNRAIIRNNARISMTNITGPYCILVLLKLLVSYGFLMIMGYIGVSLESGEFIALDTYFKKSLSSMIVFSFTLVLWGILFLLIVVIMVICIYLIIDEVIRLCKRMNSNDYHEYHESHEYNDYHEANEVKRREGIIFV